MVPFYFLRLDKLDFAAVVAGADGEVEPVVALGRALDEQLIKVPLRAIGDIQQNVRIAKRLFDAHATDVHRAARQMVARWRAPYRLVHLRRTITRIDNNRGIPPIVQRIMTIPQILQPVLAEIAKVLNRLLAGNIHHLYTRLAQLPERIVLGEVHVFVDTYFFHKIDFVNEAAKPRQMIIAPVF